MDSWFIFSSYRKITFLGKTMSNPPHPSTKPTSMAIQLKTGNERRVSGFGFCNWEPGTRNSEPSLHTTISPKNAAYPLKVFIAANKDCPHRIQQWCFQFRINSGLFLPLSARGASRHRCGQLAPSLSRAAVQKYDTIPSSSTDAR